ncbi:ferritin-like superfamily [Mycena vitilis]|nr:ferritin-like superfamily [Mycena vitilis]
MDNPGTHNKNYVLYPIRERAMWDLYKAAESQFWTAEDFAFPAKDALHPSRINSILPLTSTIRSVVQEILAHHDNTLLDKLGVNTVHQEAKFFLNYQAMMRNIHAEAYQNLLLYITTDSEQDKPLVNWDIHTPRREWATVHLANHSHSIGVLAAMAACIEAIFATPFQIAAQLAGKTIPNTLEIARKIRADQDLTIEFLVQLCAQNANCSHLPAIRATITDALRVELLAIEGASSCHICEAWLKHTTGLRPESLTCTVIQDRASDHVKKTASGLLSRFETALKIKQVPTRTSLDRRRTTTAKTRVPDTISTTEDF